MIYALLGFFFFAALGICAFGYLYKSSLEEILKTLRSLLQQSQDIVDRTKPQLILADWETLDQLKGAYKEVHQACKDLSAKELKVSTTIDLPNGEDIGELPEKVRILTAAIGDLATQFDDFKKYVIQIRGR